MRYRKNIFIAVAAVAGIVLFLFPLIVQKFVQIDTYRDTILAQLKTALNRPITYKTGKFSAFLGPSFTFNEIQIHEPDGSRTFVTADRITFKLALLPLLEKKLVLKKMVIEKLKITLMRDERGRLSVADLLEGESKVPLHLRGITVKDCALTFVDRAVSPEVITTIDKGDFSISRLTRGRSTDLKFGGRISNGRSWGEFHVTGSADLAKANVPLLQSAADLKVSLKNIDPAHFWPYYKTYVPFQRPDGAVTLNSTFKGTLSRFHSKGSFGVTNLKFNYPSVFHAVLSPQDVEAHYDLTVDPSRVAVKGLNLKVDGLRIKCSCTIADIPSRDPIITAEATTSTFSLEKFRDYIPYGIIVKDTSEFIEAHVLGGTYRLIEGKLNGRASQIAHMEKGTNYKVLFIRGTVENGLLSFGKTVPTFNDISGTLQLFEKDFILSGMSGKFGSSPFTLEGRIKDYCLDIPSAYPFTMDGTPNVPEISWLVGNNLKLQFSGESHLKMSGAGTTAAYGLAGNWNLSPATYALTDLVYKPAGIPSSLAFKATLTDSVTKISDARLTLGTVQIALAATHRLGPKSHTDVAIKSNLFPLADLKKFSPKLQYYDASGKAQVTMNGGGMYDEPQQMNWAGTVRIEGGAYSIGHGIRRFTDVNGSIGFGTNNIESALLTGRIGSSTFYAKGNMTFQQKSPIVTLSFSSPALDSVDLGFVRGKEHLAFQNIQGNIQYKADSISIRSLSAKVGESAIKVRGSIVNLDHPDIDIAVSAPYLQTSDLLGLMSLERDVKETAGKRFTVKAAIDADTGNIGKTRFRNLSGNATYQDEILYLQGVEVAVIGGRLTGKGRFDIGAEGMSRYQASFDLQKASAEQLLHVFDVEHDTVTGTVSVQGDITGKGATLPEIKKSLLGWLKFKAEEGKLRRFSFLSKVFSILNISQLLKFQLPDMVSGGMPYNTIAGTVSFRDGIASSKDIFVDSDAMNISIVGKSDLVKEELDLTIGVQPLQTLDKVVNRIPIVGWILTGKGKTVITSYFEAKGKWDDPNVSAIPVKSMGKGVFDIFKRVFQLPEKLFTETGEVIIGK